MPLAGHDNKICWITVVFSVYFFKGSFILEFCLPNVYNRYNYIIYITTDDDDEDDDDHNVKET